MRRSARSERESGVINWSKPYERADIEFEPVSTGDTFVMVCKHCDEPKARHWQTADGKIWCIRNTESEGEK